MEGPGRHDAHGLLGVRGFHRERWHGASGKAQAKREDAEAEAFDDALRPRSAEGPVARSPRRETVGPPFDDQIR